MASHEHGIGQIRRLARHAERRIRLDRALRVGATALCAALIVSIGDVAMRKVGFVSEGVAWAVLGIAAAGVGGALFTAWSWRLPERAGARALDRFHSLHDRLASALAFADRPERSAFMDAAIEDGIGAAPGAQPRLAVPIRMSRTLASAAALAGALAAVCLFEVRTHVRTAHIRTIDPIDMAPDDLEDVKDFLAQLRQRESSEDTKADVEEFNRLVDDIANRRLDRTEAFRRMQALDDRLLTGTAADKRALEEQLEKIGEELKKADLTRPFGDALADDKLGRARDALRELAKKVSRDRSAPVDKAKLDQMRETLKRAAAEAEKRRQELEQRRQELADEILKRKQKMGDGGSDEERSLLEKKQRELERLDRDQNEQSSAGRQLDRLDRDLEQAAEDLAKDLGLASKDLDQGAEDVNRMDQQQMTDQEKEELRQKLQELRELVRQQGQGGKGQVMRLKRFGRMARGQAGQSGSDPGGQSESGQGEGTGPGSEGQQDQGGQPGQGKQGQGGSQGAGQGGEVWVVGPNGEKILMLSKGQGSSGASEGAGNAGEGQGQPGRWGEGHDPHLQGKATSPKMGTQDTQVAGADADRGATRSQVILGAAERGFASHGYKKVYTEYHQVAEESFAKDDIPGGYRFYVKRYFQLIRPREER
jgi:hypothetical protein